MDEYRYRRLWWYSNGKQTYSDQCIEFILTLKFVYHLPLRAVIGFVQSIFLMNSMVVSIPDYTTVSRRAKKIKVSLRKKKKDTVALLVDSTGLKVYGEGEWKVRKHGVGYRRTWKKLHVGVDTDGEVRSVAMSHIHAHDVRYAESLILQETTPVTMFAGDGAYDSTALYQLLEARGVDEILIPPQKNSIVSEKNHHRRNTIITQGIDTWKKQSLYHQRSKAETHMYRHKQLLSPYLDMRNDQSQLNEIRIKCNILNKMLVI